jgi:hypothetical protein
MKIRYMGASPSIGYGQPQEIKHTHPLGLPEALVQAPSEVKGLKNVVVRIAGGVGRKKREEIIKLCEAAKIRVVNKSKKYPAKPEKKAKAEDKKKPAAQQPAAKPEEKKAQPASQAAKPEEKKPEAKAENKA